MVSASVDLAVVLCIGCSITALWFHYTGHDGCVLNVHKNDNDHAYIFVQTSCVYQELIRHCTTMFLTRRPTWVANSV